MRPPRIVQLRERSVVDEELCDGLSERASIELAIGTRRAASASPGHGIDRIVLHPNRCLVAPLRGRVEHHQHVLVLADEDDLASDFIATVEK